MHSCDIYCVEIFGLVFFLWAVLSAVIMPNFLCALTRSFLLDYLANLVGLFCRIMSTGSPQRRVCQRTEGDRATLRAKIMVRYDIMVAPLDSIHDTIQTYHWGYLHSCACVVYTRLVRISMPTSRWCRTMTAGWCFSPLFLGILSLLIPRSSVSSLEFLFSNCLQALIMTWYCLHLWKIFENSSTHFHRERSAPPPSGLVPYSPLTACWPRLFSTTYGQLSSTVT